MIALCIILGVLVVGVMLIILSSYLKEKIIAPYAEVLDEYLNCLICECKTREDVEKLEKYFYDDLRIFSPDGECLCKDLLYKYELLSDLFTATIDCWKRIEYQKANPKGCKSCYYWMGFFSDSEGDVYCPDCGTLIIERINA